MRTADEIVQSPWLTEKSMTYRLAGDEVAVLLTVFGATPLEELYVLYRKIDELLREKGLVCIDLMWAEICMLHGDAGMSLSLMKLDDELKAVVGCPCRFSFL